MRVVYASDDYYYRYVYISIRTLLESNGSNPDLKITYIEQDVTEEHKALLAELGRSFNKEVEIIQFDMPEAFQDLPACNQSKTTFAKFLFASLFPDDDVVLFIDPDTLVLRDIAPIFDIGTDDYMFAGVIENLPAYQRTTVGMAKEDDYINGGVVLCNLKKWRECDFEKKVLDYMLEGHHNRNYDQGIINELCRGQLAILPPKFSALAEVFDFKDRNKLLRRYGFARYYTQEEIDEAVQNPVIVHFTHFLYGKPLNAGCQHPYTQMFLDYLHSSPLDPTLEADYRDGKMKMRKWFLDHTPFCVYLAVEALLDSRRRIMLATGRAK